MEDVSYTAMWTAAARALESERSNGLFKDEYARELAEPRGFEFLARYQGGGVTEFIAIRTRYMDDSIARILAQGQIRQVVLVANGMDTRTYRMSWPDDTIVYELDHCDLLTDKQERMIRLAATPRVTTVQVGTDITGDWRTALEASGFAPHQPTLWVAEGLMFFLTEHQAGRLLADMAGASGPSSGLVVDMTSTALLKHPMTQPFLARLCADGTPWQFGTDDPTGFLLSHDWVVRDLKQPGEPGAGEGRWPYAVPSSGVRGVPRNWLINAVAATA